MNYKLKHDLIILLDEIISSVEGYLEHEWHGGVEVEKKREQLSKMIKIKCELEKIEVDER